MSETEAMDQISLLHLRYFLEVVEAGAVRAAADSIGISQPSQPAGGSPGEKARCALVRSFFHWNASHRRRAAPRRYCCADRPDDGWP